MRARAFVAKLPTLTATKAQLERQEVRLIRWAYVGSYSPLARRNENGLGDRQSPGPLVFHGVELGRPRLANERTGLISLCL
jgi:hypothetical protein